MIGSGGNSEREVVFKLRVANDPRNAQSFQRMADDVIKAQRQIDQAVRSVGGKSGFKSFWGQTEMDMDKLAQTSNKSFRGWEDGLRKIAQANRAAEDAANRLGEAQVKAAEKAAAAQEKAAQRAMAAQTKANVRAVDAQYRNRAMGFGGMVQAGGGLANVAKGVAYTGLMGEENSEKILATILGVEGGLSIGKGAIQMGKGLGKMAAGGGVGGAVASAVPYAALAAAIPAAIAGIGTWTEVLNHSADKADSWTRKLGELINKTPVLGWLANIRGASDNSDQVELTRARGQLMAESMSQDRIDIENAGRNAATFGSDILAEMSGDKRKAIGMRLDRAKLEGAAGSLELSSAYTDADKVSARSRIVAAERQQLDLAKERYNVEKEITDKGIEGANEIIKKSRDRLEELRKQTQEIEKQRQSAIMRAFMANPLEQAQGKAALEKMDKGGQITRSDAEAIMKVAGDKDQEKLRETIARQNPDSFFSKRATAQAEVAQRPVDKESKQLEAKIAEQEKEIQSLKDSFAKNSEALVDVVKELTKSYEANSRLLAEAMHKQRDKTAQNEGIVRELTKR